MQDKIAAALSAALAAGDAGIDKSPADLEALLEVPKDPKMGDVAFPCFTLARDLRQAPQQIAASLAAALDGSPALGEAGITAVPTGPYLNFTVDKSRVSAEVVPAILNGSFLARREGAELDKIMVEYSQPNTHKAFHVGHIRNAALGDALTRIFEWSGHETVPVNYIGDEGTHVAKCLWYLRTHHEGGLPDSNLGEFLGELYTRSTRLLDLGAATRAPHPGVVASRALSIEPHPAEPRWQVCVLETPQGEKTVVTAGKGFAIGDLVPWVPSGMRFAGREVGVLDKQGVTSEGMLASGAELSISSDGDSIPVLPAGASVGDEVVELYRIPAAEGGSVPDGVSVDEELARRKAEVSAVLQAIESGEGEVWQQWRDTRQWSLDEFQSIYAWLDCRFDDWFYESEFGESGKELVRAFQEKGVFVESEGAVGADLSEQGLGFCVLIKRDGTALYATRDLALAQVKFDKFGVDRSYYVVDSAQTLHFQQVFQCLERMGYAQAAKCHHLAYARVVLPDGEMSSRKGGAILFSELKSRLLERIQAEFLEKYRGDWPDAEIDAAAHALALATMRYGMLKQNSASKIVFDLDEWSARSGDTGPYLMYAYARTRSILSKVHAAHPAADPERADWSLLVDDTETELISHLAAYPAVVQRAADEAAPAHVCSWLYELARRFHRMHKQCSVLHADSDALRDARSLLVDAVGRALGHGLGLLGVPTIERM